MRDAELPEIPDLDTVKRRVESIFPAGIDNHGYVTREMASKTIFVMLYTDAIEGHGWLRPNQITRMTDVAADARGEDDRRNWTKASLLARGDIPGRWYADNTREPIRDETLRYGLLAFGAVVEREGLKTTASTPRWALAADFAELFLCSEEEFPARVTEWRANHLTPAALARLAAVQAGIAGGKEGEILVTLPNLRTRVLAPGESSIIAKAVVEEFAPRFLERPGVVWLSESSRKDEGADLRLAKLVKLDLSESRILPDVILVDLAEGRSQFVFVEVVSTDGPINEQRKTDLTKLLEQGGHSLADAAFVTAFLDRGQASFRRLSSHIAWDSYVWFAAEPEKMIHFRDLEHETRKLFHL